MKLYHGTVKAYLPEILKEGLKPIISNRWKACWPEDPTSAIDKSEENGVYLSKSLISATCYAKTRANYLAAKPGGFFKWGGNATKPFKKMDSAPVIHTEPVVLEIDLSSTAHIVDDPHCYSSYTGETTGFIYKGVIPPSLITVV